MNYFLLLSYCLFFTSIITFAQVGIGIDSPNPNAQLDVVASDKGVLGPRMDSAHRKNIPNTVGLLVYDSTTGSFWYNNGTAWLELVNSGSSAKNSNNSTFPNIISLVVGSSTTISVNTATPTAYLISTIGTTPITITIQTVVPILIGTTMSLVHRAGDADIYLNNIPFRGEGLTLYAHKSPSRVIVMWNGVQWLPISGL